MKIYKTTFLLFSFFWFLACGPAEPSAQKEEVSEPKVTNSTSPATQPAATSNKKKILFFGNSLTAAYGLNPEQGFAGLIQQKIDSLDLTYQVVNAGLSGETTKGGLERIDWILEQNKIDIFLLELGGNDALRGIDTKASYNNLEGIIKKVKAKNSDVSIVLAGMEAPPNMGDDFTSKFRKMYPDLAKKYEAALIPFLLDGVGGIPSLNLADGIHPNVKGHKIVAENIWKILKPLL